MKYYSIYDKKAQKYFVPVIFENDAVAFRWFTAVVNGDQDIIRDFPEDYVLCTIGTFDERTGIFNPDLKEIKEAILVSRKEK